MSTVTVVPDLLSCPDLSFGPQSFQSDLAPQRPGLTMSQAVQAVEARGFPRHVLHLGNAMTRIKDGCKFLDDGTCHV